MYRAQQLTSLVVFIVIICSSSLRADDIADALAAAKREFAMKLEFETPGILRELRSRLTIETDAGNLAAVEVTEAEIDAVIKSGTLPKPIATTEIGARIEKARAQLENSYTTAISNYTKVRQTTNAKRIRDELLQFKKTVPSVQSQEAARKTEVSSGRFVVIASPVSGKLVSVGGGSLQPGAQVIQWEPVELHAEMSWELVPAKDGWFFIKNRKSGQALAVAQALKTDGADVIQWPLDKDALEHQWRTVTVGQNAVMIENRNSSKFLSLQDPSTENGVKLVQSPRVLDSRHQIWRVVPVK